MRFFVGDDDQTVVEEALAFIDSCGTDSSASCSEGDHSADAQASGEEATSGDRSASVWQIYRPAQPQTKPTAKKRRIKTFASSSTRQLQRKRAEKLALREQELVLQAQLDLLKRSKYAGLTRPQHAFSCPANGAANAEWHDQAVTQYVRRQQSEKTNRQLRAILANQEHTGEALRAILQRRTVLEGMELVFGVSAPLYRAPQTLDNSAGIMTMLEKRAEDLYVDSGAGFGWDLPCLVTSKMNVNHNTQYGKVIEIETVTPVSCSIQEASAVLWKDLKTVHQIPDKRYRYVSHPTVIYSYLVTNKRLVLFYIAAREQTQFTRKELFMKLRGQHSDIEINESHFSRKFEEAQRIVIAKADSIILPTQGLEFKSPSWTTITASESDLEHVSVVRSYLRIYAEVQPNLAARLQDVEGARNFILSGLSKMMFSCAQKTQSELIQQSLVI